MTLVLNEKNINNCIQSIKAQITSTNHGERGMYLVVPASYKAGINRKKYKGIGRPREDDYIYEPFIDLFKTNGTDPETIRSNPQQEQI